MTMVFVKQPRIHRSVKKEAVNAILNTLKKKLIQLFSLHPIDHQVSPCYHSCLRVFSTYFSMVTPISLLHAEKIPEAVLLYFKE